MVDLGQLFTIDWVFGSFCSHQVSDSMLSLVGSLLSKGTGPVSVVDGGSSTKIRSTQLSQPHDDTATTSSSGKKKQHKSKHSRKAEQMEPESPKTSKKVKSK